MSGGDGREILFIEKQFIKQIKIPVMGICYGHLMIASSFGKPQYHLAVPRLEMLEAVNESLIGSYAFRNSPRTLRYNHSWGVSAADLESADFTIIMKEVSRVIEPSSGEQSRGLLQYRIGTEIDLTLAAEYDKDEKYVLSVQGHPESEGVDVDVSDSIFRRFLRKVANFEDIPSEYADTRLIAHETTSLSLDVNQEKVYYTL